VYDVAAATFLRSIRDKHSADSVNNIALQTFLRKIIPQLLASFNEALKYLHA
jgi:hypothetical protein